MDIIIVDDHPMVIDLYEKLLRIAFQSVDSLSIIKANTSKEAWSILDSKTNNFDLAILDYSLPSYPEKNILSGGDLAKLITEYHQKCKIIVITAQVQVLLVYDILKKIKPHGMVIKNDVTTENFTEIISTVINGNQFQSKSVKECVSTVWNNKVLNDNYNREILIHLGNGFKVNELHKYVPLAEITIKKRLSSIKKSLQITNDSNLVREAKKIGLL